MSALFAIGAALLLIAACSGSYLVGRYTKRCEERFWQALANYEAKTIRNLKRQLGEDM